MGLWLLSGPLALRVSIRLAGESRSTVIVVMRLGRLRVNLVQTLGLRRLLLFISS